MSSNSDFGLKDYHETNIVNYMRFSRTQRALSIRTIQAAFKDIQNARYKIFFVKASNNSRNFKFLM